MCMWSNRNLLIPKMEFDNFDGLLSCSLIKCGQIGLLKCVMV